jgi:hypothetical protein
MFLSSEIADNFASRQPFLFAIDSPNKTRYYEIHPLGVKASRSLKIQAICTRNSIQLGWNRLNDQERVSTVFRHNVLVREASSLPRSGGSLFGALCSRNGECACLRSTAPTPGHVLQRFEKVDKLSIRKRTEGPAFMSANEAPAIWDKAVHRRSDTRMKVSAGVDAIVLSKTGNILNF